MFYAINSNTKKIISSLTILKDASYQNLKDDKWFADPTQIISYDANLVKDVNEIEVAYIKEQIKQTQDGKLYHVAPHFRILNKQKLGITTTPESKEHKQIKNWLITQLEEISIIYSEIKKNNTKQEAIKLIELGIDWENIKLEAPTQEIYGDKTRLDILVPFLIKDNILGKGIAFEIQLSKQKSETTEQRNKQRGLQGWSVVWLFKDDFDIISDEMIFLKNTEIVCKTFASIINDIRTKTVPSLKQTVQLQSRLMDKKVLDSVKILEDKTEFFNNKILEDITSLIDNKIKEASDKYAEQIANKIKILAKQIAITQSTQPTCPKCDLLMVKKSGNFGSFWGCVNYPDCKVTSKEKEIDWDVFDYD